MRGVAAGLALPRFRGQRWLVVSAMNAYANRVCRFLVNGCDLSLAIDDRDYGLRDFTLADPDGFGVRFGTWLHDL
jgi:hypothetical protein